MGASPGFSFATFLFRGKRETPQPAGAYQPMTYPTEVVI